MRKSTILRTEINAYGYADEYEFRQTEENGLVRYDLYVTERWEDGHVTYPSHRHLRFKNAENGNKLFKEALANGFKRV